MKKSLVLVLIFGFLLVLPSVLAMSIEKDYSTNVVITDLNQPAKVKLTITGAEEGTYSIYTLTDVRILPSSPIYLNPIKNEVVVYVYPTDSLKKEGSYSFEYFIKKLDGGTTKDKMLVKLVTLQDALELSSDSNNPDAGQMTFYIKNKEPTEIKNVKAKFSSIFFETEQTFNIEPLAKKEFTVNVDKENLKTIEAGSYLLKGEFTTPAGKKDIEGRVYLGEKKGVDSEETIEGFLIRTQTIRKTNFGNVQETVSVSAQRGLITRLFTFFNLDPDVVDREGFSITYSWTRTLKPSEVLLIKAKTNYIFPLIIILFLVIVVFSIRMYNQNIVEVEKSVQPVKTKGGQFALRVRLNVKSRKPVENVSLIDRIPAIVKVYEKFETVKPDKIDTKERRLQWNIGNLNPGEERFFSYVVYSKVGVVGKFVLPSALAVFESENEISEVASNKVYFLSEQIKKEE